MGDTPTRLDTNLTKLNVVVATDHNGIASPPLLAPYRSSDGDDDNAPRIYANGIVNNDRVAANCSSGSDIGYSAHSFTNNENGRTYASDLTNKINVANNSYKIENSNSNVITVKADVINI